MLHGIPLVHTENMEYGILYSICKIDIRSVCDMKNYSGFLDISYNKKVLNIE